MSEAETIKLSFKAPDVAPLPEVATLARSLSLVNNKVEELVPMTSSSSQQESNHDKPKPLRRLVIREVTYGSDLVLVLLGPSNIASFIPEVLRGLRDMKIGEKERIARAKRENKDTTERSFRRLLRSEAGDKLRKVLDNYAGTLGIKPESLLEETTQDLENVYRTNIEILG